ncbi:MAG: HAMP domain-containing histidine kinase [Alphaproteobacteria bacterium]|nr:HAMP domain-containing histidine kinase [Alphaproteobacteria bacterium]
MRSVLLIAAVLGASGALLGGLGAAAVLAWIGAPTWGWLLGGAVAGVGGGLAGVAGTAALPVPKPPPPPPPLAPALAELRALADGESTMPPHEGEEGPPELMSAIRDTATAIRQKRSRLERQHLDATVDLEQAQARVAKLESALASSRQQYRESLSVQEAFLSRMSHELRTPLNAISGYVEMLLEEVEEPFVDDLRRIRLASLNLTALVTSVLDLTELQSGSYAVRPEPIALAELIRSVVDSTQITADNQRNRLEVEVPANLLVVLDKRMLQSVLFNLVSNACKYTVGGVVRVVVTQDPEAEGGPRVSIRIEDTGIGMTERQIEAAFRPFTQADETSTRRYDGSGVGLAVVKGFVESMDGTVAIDSEPGKGARVTVSLPVEAEARSEDPFGEDEPTMLVR